VLIGDETTERWLCSVLARLSLPSKASEVRPSNKLINHQLCINSLCALMHNLGNCGLPSEDLHHAMSTAPAQKLARMKPNA